MHKTLCIIKKETNHHKNGKQQLNLLGIQIVKLNYLFKKKAHT